jgi:hypothetical protein
MAEGARRKEQGRRGAKEQRSKGAEGLHTRGAEEQIN